jgi:hypothetical protein
MNTDTIGRVGKKVKGTGLRNKRLMQTGVGSEKRNQSSNFGEFQHVRRTEIQQLTN